MANPKFYRFEVSGRGAFPFDMLRYDSCFPERSEDASQLYISREDDGYLEPRTVRLVSLNHPTVERWRSFLWGCREVD